MNVFEFLVSCFELLDLVQRDWFRALLKVVLFLVVVLGLFLGLCWIFFHISQRLGF